VERVLTGKLLTSELPTGMFSTDKVVCNTVIKVLPECYLKGRHPEISSSKIGLFQTYIYTASSLSHHFENMHTCPNLFLTIYGLTLTLATL
jgi:hypothetical protein